MKMTSLICGLVLTLSFIGCSKKEASTPQQIITVDGSSTVFPITEAMAEEFQKTAPNVRVTIGVSGTGGGFKKFTAGEVDINNASRTIKEEEKAKALEHQIEYVEIPVAFDGITIVVNPKNTWAKDMTKEELHKIWAAESTVKTWDQVRAGWPKKEIKLYGPGTDSGTFDYFTEAVNGKAQSCRADFTKSEDDNVLVQGVAGDEGALGFFGYSYYISNKDKVNLVAINGILPTIETINNATYAPLSRKVFIYVNKKSLKEKAELQNFIRFYLQSAPKLVAEIGFVALSSAEYEGQLQATQAASK